MKKILSFFYLSFYLLSFKRACIALPLGYKSEKKDKFVQKKDKFVQKKDKFVQEKR